MYVRSSARGRVTTPYDLGYYTKKLVRVAHAGDFFYQTVSTLSNSQFCLKVRVVSLPHIILNSRLQMRDFGGVEAREGEAFLAEVFERCAEEAAIISTRQFIVYNFHFVPPFLLRAHGKSKLQTLCCNAPVRLSPTTFLRRRIW